MNGLLPPTLIPIQGGRGGTRSEGRRHPHVNFIKRANVSILLLQIFGILPAENPDPTRGGRKTIVHWRGRLLLCLTVVYVLVSGSIGGVAFWVLKSYIDSYDFWNPETFQAMITALKPLQSLFNLMCFACVRSSHQKLLRQLNLVDRCMGTTFRCYAKHTRFNCIIAWSVAVLFVITFILRTIEFTVVPDENLGNHTTSLVIVVLFEYVPFLLLPTFSVWQLLPLVYYCGLLWLICYWLRKLSNAMFEDRTLQRLCLQIYIDQFTRLAKLQKYIGDVFHLFVLVNLGLCVVTLCLTVYIVTQSQFMESQNELDEIFYCNVVWSALQIVVLFLYLVGLCMAGSITNERSRVVLQAAIAMRPRDENERFLVFCLTERIHSQHCWGISVWRGFLIERGLLFSVVGLIITYALVLLRMKENKCPTVADYPANLTMDMMSQVAS